MRMLDIDMDFFQTGIHCWECDNDTFLKDDREIDVWEADKIVLFLEEQCGLDRREKIKGRIVKHHVEAYLFWGELINNNKVIVPFEVTHIDAHSDLAFSPNVEYYRFLKNLDRELSEELKLGTVFEERSELIDSGNYLLAAVINGWINKVNYVYHQDLDYLDVTEYIVENVIPRKKFRFNFCNQIKEKDIYLEVINPSDFQNREMFDYATIALSPPYVKKEMEKRLEIMKEYIEII